MPIWWHDEGIYYEEGGEPIIAKFFDAILGARNEPDGAKTPAVSLTHRWLLSTDMTPMTEQWSWLISKMNRLDTAGPLKNADAAWMFNHRQGENLKHANRYGTARYPYWTHHRGREK
jgi:hypothetical protein